MPSDTAEGSERSYIPINVDPARWERLNGLKQPGDSFDDVIDRLLERPASLEAAIDDASDEELVDALEATELPPTVELEDGGRDV